MATRKKKKKAKKKAAKSSAAARRARSAIARIEAELPPTLRDYAKQVETRLNRLEGRIEKAGARARKQALATYRDGLKQLGALEARGEAAWKRLTTAAQKEARNLLGRLEDAVSAATGGAKKKTTKRRAKKATARRAPKKKA